MMVPGELVAQRLDLRDDSAWSPLVQVSTVGSIEVASWVEPRLPGEPSFDLAGMVPVPGGVRLVVIDPVLVSDAPDPVSAARESVLMAGGLMEILRMPGDVDELLAWAVARWAVPGWVGPAATVAVVELTNVGVRAWRHGDCQVWVDDPGLGECVELFPGDMLSPSGRAAWDARDLDVSPMGEQRRLLDDPGAWVSAPVGFPGARAERAEWGEWARCVVATDGVVLDKEGARWPFRFLFGDAQVAPEGWLLPSPHGDLALMEARQARTRGMGPLGKNSVRA